MHMLPFSTWYTGTQFSEWAFANEMEISPLGTAEMLWVDLETTGLSPIEDPIIESGIILTDRFGRVIQGGAVSWLIFDVQDRHYNYKIHNLDPYVRDMHDRSGLLRDLAEAMRLPEVQMISRGRVERAMLEWVSHFAYPGGVPANIKDRLLPSGSSVHFDRAHLSFQMREFHDALHYRNGVDASAWRYVTGMLNPSVAAGMPELPEVHRPIPDLIRSIKMYRYMMQNFVRVDTTETIAR